MGSPSLWLVLAGGVKTQSVALRTQLLILLCTRSFINQQLTFPTFKKCAAVNHVVYTLGNGAVKRN